MNRFSHFFSLRFLPFFVLNLNVHRSFLNFFLDTQTSKMFCVCVWVHLAKDSRGVSSISHKLPLLDSYRNSIKCLHDDFEGVLFQVGCLEPSVQDFAWVKKTRLKKLCDSLRSIPVHDVTAVKGIQLNKRCSCTRVHFGFGQRGCSKLSRVAGG